MYMVASNFVSCFFSGPVPEFPYVKIEDAPYVLAQLSDSQCQYLKERGVDVAEVSTNAFTL